MSILASRSFRFSVRQTLAIVLIFVMIALLVPTPSAAAVLHATDNTVRAAGNCVWTWFASTLTTLGSITNSQEIRERQGVRPLAPPTKAEREAQVATIELNVAGEIVLRSRQPLSLAASPLDQEGRPLHGIRAGWESSDKRVVFVRKTGEAMAGLPGEATITARAGNKSATVHVTVVEGTKDPFGGTKRLDSTRRSVEQAFRQRSQGDSAVAGKLSRREKRAHAIGKLAGLKGLMPFVRPPNDDPLPDNETSSLYEPNNLTGTPPGKKKAGAR